MNKITFEIKDYGKVVIEDVTGFEFDGTTYSVSGSTIPPFPLTTENVGSFTTR